MLKTFTLSDGTGIKVKATKEVDGTTLHLPPGNYDTICGKRLVVIEDGHVVEINDSVRDVNGELLEEVTPSE